MAKLYIGNTAYKVMLGNNSGHIADLPTIVWNQLVQNGDFSEGGNTPTEWTGYTSCDNSNTDYILFNTGSGNVNTARPFIGGHKYFIKFRWMKKTSSGFFIVLNDLSDVIDLSTPVDVWNERSIIKTARPPSTFSNTYGIIGFRCSDFWIDKKYGINIIDLTLMFGAGNEPTTVAQFEQWFTDNIGSLDNYYPYNEGEEIKVKYLPKYM